jgi:hypothetical protein
MKQAKGTVVDNEKKQKINSKKNLLICRNFAKKVILSSAKELFPKNVRIAEDSPIFCFFWIGLQLSLTLPSIQLF